MSTGATSHLKRPVFREMGIYPDNPVPSPGRVTEEMIWLTSG